MLGRKWTRFGYRLSRKSWRELMLVAEMYLPPPKDHDEWSCRRTNTFTCLIVQQQSGVRWIYTYDCIYMQGERERERERERRQCSSTGALAVQPGDVCHFLLPSRHHATVGDVEHWKNFVVAAVLISWSAFIFSNHLIHDAGECIGNGEVCKWAHE